jgi:hypothetical protein
VKGTTQAAEKRRGERIPGRFTVAVREKLATWVTLTEDVSARGCRIEAKRPLTPGTLVQLAFDMGSGNEPLVVHAQVAWVTRAPPHRAGLAFLSVPRQPSQAQPRDWIESVLAAPPRDAPAAPRPVAPRPPARQAKAGPIIVPPGV